MFRASALALLLAVPAAAADRVTVTKKSYARVPGVAAQPAEPPVILEGDELKPLSSKIKAAVKALGKRKTWNEYGPDASFVAVTLEWKGKVYEFDSWRPLYRDDDKVAVTEKRGLVFVRDAAEKARVEKENGPKYRAVAAFLDALPR